MAMKRTVLYLTIVKNIFIFSRLLIFLLSLTVPFSIVEAEEGDGHVLVFVPSLLLLLYLLLPALVDTVHLNKVFH